MRILYTDIETFNPYHSLPLVGTDVYKRHAEPIIATWAWQTGPVYDWQLGQDPSDYLEALATADMLVAHNAWFEHNVLSHVGWCRRPVKDWHCTMAQAYAHQMPGSLEALGRFLGLPPELLKKEGGKALIALFCGLQRKRKGELRGRRVMPVDRPEEWQRFVTYGRGDTATLRVIHKKLPRVNLHE